jgi:ferredoxin/flavodoxin---NADP+ reductase
VDLFERLPSPYGLVRSGVAPDHQGIKKVSKAFDRIAAHDRLRYFGNVTVGKDISAKELMEHYDQVLYAVGAASDRRLGIPGEDLQGSYAATAFVGWYNGHPDYRDQKFDLTAKRAVVVGLGNVAMDVTRILARDPKELAETDIADYALAALRESKIEEVVVLGRRGPAQSAFTPREIMDIGELPGVQLRIDGEPGTIRRDEALVGAVKKNVDYLAEVAALPHDTSAKRVVRLRFLCSPTAVVGDDGRMVALEVEHNELLEGADGRLRARGTGERQTIEAGLLFRSIGYRGIPIDGVPFDEESGTIPNSAGRVLSQAGGELIPGLYTVGWIKRGPSGLIGTNKSCAKETADLMLADARDQGDPSRSLPDKTAVERLLAQRGVRVVSIADWQRLDDVETTNGKKGGKVREKLTSVDAMLKALG